MSQETRQRKQALRESILGLGEPISAETRIRDSARLCERLRGQPAWREARSVGSFFPMAAEPDVRPVIEEALRGGKIVALPRFDPLRRGYDLVRIESLAELHPGHFGILEPGSGSALKLLDLILVPGVAYDENGRRLGRGKGYYDRLLAQVQGCKCGVAFDWQLIDEVPAESHDVRVNWILTPSRWVECAG